MPKGSLKSRGTRVKFWGVLLIFLASNSLTGCAKNVKKPLSGVCVIRIDWTDESLDRLNDRNKVAILTYDAYCGNLAGEKDKPF
nr:MAG TPA: hypothetical protein [Caudoviricetes sp.]